MNAVKHTPWTSALVQKSISGVGLIFLLGFMLLCAWGVVRGLNAQSGQELFGHAYAISVDQVPSHTT